MIQLAHPWALLALLAIPAILLLHFLRPRRRSVAVPSTWLWDEALRERRRGLGLRKLLRSVSLLLLLAFALAAALGLAGPEWLTRSTAQGDTVLVIDVSASMQARDGFRSRFERAVEAAGSLVDALPEGARMLIMSSGRAPVLRTAFESNTEILHRALSQLAVTDEAGRPREALNLALSLLRSSERGRVRFVTDGAFDPALDPGSPRVEYLRVGRPARNLAITRFDFRAEPGSEDRFQVLVSLRNYTDEAIVVPLIVDLERRRLLAREVTLVAGGEETLVLPFRGRARGRATARIVTDDDLAADDRAYAVLNVPEPRRVLLASPGNFYLQSVLAAMPNVEYTAVDAVAPDDLQRQAQAYDVVILDRVAVPALPRGNFLLVDTLPAGLPFTARGEVEAPVILGQGTSSLVRDLDLSAVGIDAARRVAVSGPVPGLQRLFWSAETPLALALLQEGRRVVYLGFDLTRSSLPLETAFPLLIGQSLDWLRPADNHAGVSQLAAGEAHLIRVPSTHTDLILRTPDGEGQTHLLEDGELRFDATSVAGIYRYSVNQVARYFAVNLTDARESNINSAALPARRAEAVSGDRADAQAVLPLWWALSALALALLALEWTVWCARRGDA